MWKQKKKRKKYIIDSFHPLIEIDTPGPLSPVGGGRGGGRRGGGRSWGRRRGEEGGGERI